MTRSTALALVLVCLAGCEGGDVGGSGGEAGAPSTASGSPTGATTGAGSSTATSGGAGGGMPGLVPAFVAQGHMGRLTISCDDGQSFVADQSLDDSVRCFDDGFDCDHHEGAGRGLAFGAGAFVAVFGWGAPGTIQRSTDGVTWQTVVADTPTFADVAFGNGTFVANQRTVLTSADGSSWAEGGDLDLVPWNVRAIGFVPHDGGSFVVTGESGSERDVVVSADGQTWVHPTTRPDACGAYVRNVAYGAGTIAIFSGHGTVCTSTDGGDTWTLSTVAPGFTSNGLWTGAEFMVWDGGTVYRSPDAVDWTSAIVAPSDVRIGPVARGESGTFVAAEDSWGGWYEEQDFYRSADGVTWEKLAPGSFVGSHPITFIEFGWVEPSEACPAP